MCNTRRAPQTINCTLAVFMIDGDEHVAYLHDFEYVSNSKVKDGPPPPLLLHDDSFVQDIANLCVKCKETEKLGKTWEANISSSSIRCSIVQKLLLFDHAFSIHLLQWGLHRHRRSTYSLCAAWVDGVLSLCMLFTETPPIEARNRIDLTSLKKLYTIDITIPTVRLPTITVSRIPGTVENFPECHWWLTSMESPEPFRAVDWRYRNKQYEHALSIATNPPDWWLIMVGFLTWAFLWPQRCRRVPE